MHAALLALTLLHHAAVTTPPNVEALVEAAWQQAADDPGHDREVAGDKELGKKYAEEVEKELKLSKDQDGFGRVQRIGAEIAAVADKTQLTALWGDRKFSKFDYTFKLVEGKDVNAFSLPGGYIYVYEGLLKYVESDDELAGVLAHEVAHAALRHVATLQKEQQKLQTVELPLILIAIFTGKPVEAIQGAGLLNQAMGSGWSVKAEEAADDGGFQLITQTKYNPAGMLTLMERLAMDERSKPFIDWGIFRTHPPGRERAEAMQSELKKAGITVRRSQVTKTFRTTVQAGEGGTVKLMFGTHALVELSGADGVQRADDAAERFNTFFDTCPEMYEVQLKDDGSIVGKRQTLLTLTKEDADVNKKDLAGLGAQTLRNIQASLFTIGFRVWNDR